MDTEKALQLSNKLQEQLSEVQRDLADIMKDRELKAQEARAMTTPHVKVTWHHTCPICNQECANLDGLKAVACCVGIALVVWAVVWVVLS